MSIDDFFEELNLNDAFNIMIIHDKIRPGYLVNYKEDRVKYILNKYKWLDVKYIKYKSSKVIICRKDLTLNNFTEIDLGKILGYQCLSENFYLYPLSVFYMIKYETGITSILYGYKCNLNINLEKSKEILLRINILADNISKQINKNIIIDMNVKFNYNYIPFQLKLNDEKTEKNISILQDIIHPYEHLFM